jgi:hypothetical protein
MKLRRVGPLALLLLSGLPACGAMSSLDEGPCEAGQPPTCIAAPVEDPCGAPTVVAAACDAEAHGWVCPSGSRVYARAADTPMVCLPLSDLPGSISAVHGWGLGGSFVRVPTDDGRCLWIAGQVNTPMGEVVSNVAIEVDRSAPFGTCPTTGSVVGGNGGSPTSIVEVEEGADPSIGVQLASAFRVGGVTRVVYRLFKTDPNALYGVTDLGGGLGRWDAASQRIIVQGPSAITFPTSLDFGDASIVSGGNAYVWGCPKPGGFLMSDCILARFDATGSAQLFLGGASGANWTTNLDPSSAATTGLKSGPWISSVTGDSSSTGGLLHVFIGGFGATIETQLANGPTGTWSAPAPVVDCALPSTDGKSYCAGPMLHPELADPTRPGEIVVSYEIGSTAANQSALMSQDPQGYWPHLVWVTAP